MTEIATPAPNLSERRRCAGAVAWPWRAALEPSEIRGHRRRALRRQGLTRGAVALVVAGLLYAAGAGLAARVALGGATVVLLAALLSPDRLYLGIGRGLELLGRGIGRGLAILLLSPVFFLFVLPFGLLLRSGRRDRLERRFDRGAATYWHLRRDSARGRAHFDRGF